MLCSRRFKPIHIVGIAAIGSEKSPVAVFLISETGEFLSLAVSPFDAEMLISDYLGENSLTAVAWVAQLLRRKHPCRGILESQGEGEFHIRFHFAGLTTLNDPILSVSEGLVLARRLDTPLFARDGLGTGMGEGIQWHSGIQEIGDDFLYFSPPGNASTVPIM